MGPDQRTITITKTGSVADRLAALQSSAEHNWRKRISQRDKVAEIIHEDLESEILRQPLQRTTESTINTSDGSSGVSDRLGKLKSSAESWKQRIRKSDVHKFSAAGRLHEENAPLSAEPQLERQIRDTAKKCPMVIVRGTRADTRISQIGLNEDANSDAVAVDSTITGYQSEELVNYTLPTSCCNSSASVGCNSFKEKETRETSLSILRKVGSDDDIFEGFFVAKASEIGPSNLEINDFDNVKPTERLGLKRTVQRQKGRRAVHNPLKSLVNRTDVGHEYAETTTTTQKQALPSTINKNLLPEAIAGLASKENFKSFVLKPASLPITKLWLPYRPRMLLHIKGRAHVQTRLVEPTFEALNRGDCFILIAGDQLFRYVGMFANIIEISRSKKISAAIIENKELGCTAGQEICLVDGEFVDGSVWKGFFELLGKPTLSIDDVSGCGPVDEDEIFEVSLYETNRFYEFIDDSLVPLNKYWGCIPKVEMLASDKIIILDFGSELYVWNGKGALCADKGSSIRLVQEHLFASVADYSECYLSPLNYATIVGKRQRKELIKCSSRDDWCVFGRISQNMETVLFKEKFSDWPEIQCQNAANINTANGVPIIKALNGDILYKGVPYQTPNLILENTSLGRGNYFYDDSTMRHFSIITRSINKWQVHEFNFEESKAESCNHFYTSESYIIRWGYQISVTARELSGKASKRCTVGRDRCVYFCWQGNESSANEKGSAALFTVQLDKEKGAQVRVAQGEELPVFVRLFKPLYLHFGLRKDCLKRRSLWRLYHLLGNLEEEIILMEVKCESQQLRSRASILAIHGAKGNIFIWHGCRSADHSRKLASYAGELLKEQVPSDLFTCNMVEITELEEEVEDNQTYFLKEVFNNVDDDVSYVGLSMTGDAKSYNYTPRLFHLCSSQGFFKATEIYNALRCEHLNSPYPFKQAQLYNARQPTIFMFDDNDKIWLWMGWWPLDDLDKVSQLENSSTATNYNRAGVNRWISEQRAALETAVSYWRAKNGDENINGVVVWAGLEPLEFKALFPCWYDHSDIKERNLLDGRSKVPISITQLLAKITQTEYPLSELRSRPLPEGVEPTRLELYLNDIDFREALGMSRTDFEHLPLWKQTNLKRERGLF